MHFYMHACLIKGYQMRLLSFYCWLSWSLKLWTQKWKCLWLRQIFNSTCGKISLHSNFHEDTAKSYQPFTSGLCCIKEDWKGAPACPSVLPNSTSVTKLGSRLRRTHIQVCTSQTTLPRFLQIPLTLETFLFCRSSKVREKSNSVNHSL